MYYMIYKSKENKRWYWIFIANNGKVIARSAGGKEGGYSRIEDAVNAIEILDAGSYGYCIRGKE